MRLSAIFYLICFTSFSCISAQGFRCTSTGSAIPSSSNTSKHVVWQSFGQSSAIGTFSGSDKTVRQGFLQPWAEKFVRTNRNREIQVEVYPNPTRDILWFEFENSDFQSVFIRIFSLQGQLLGSRQFYFGDPQNYNLSRLSTGIYILEIQADELFAQIKIQKL